MRRTDSDKSMETVHLSEEPTNDYEEIIVQIKPKKESVSKKSWHESQPCQIVGVVCCVAASTTIFVTIVVELVNAIKGNPYL
jgi:hypothetical protein